MTDPPFGFACAKSARGGHGTPSLSTVEMLSAIWEHVLQKESIGVDDDFFSSGGSFRQADILFAQIAEQCSRELPSATIYHAPTIAALADLLDQPSLPKFSPFVQIKAGSAYPPILIVHGLAGTLPFFELAQNIRAANPIYGIQAKGVDGLEAPFETVEEMARFYLDSIKEIQLHGPYILIGYSFGGLVALQMAQHLTRMGETVALLVLLDAYPHARYLSSSERLRLMKRRAVRKALKIGPTLQRKISRLLRSVKRHYQLDKIKTGRKLPLAPSQLSFERTTLRVKEAAYLALARYRPTFYKGKISFVKSATDLYFPADPVPIWENLASGFECETVPVGHLEMVTTDTSSLAAVLARYVEKALPRDQPTAGETPVQPKDIHHSLAPR